MKKFTFFLVAVLLTLTGCENNEMSIMEKVKQEISSQDIIIDKIYHVEIINDGVLVFYKKMNKNMVSEVFLRQKENGWEWGMGYGEMSIKPDKDEFVWHGPNDVERQIFRITGVTSNPEIEKIITQRKDGSRRKAAKIINTGEGFKLWNVFYEKPFNAAVEFIAYDGDGNEILRH